MKATRKLRGRPYRKTPAMPITIRLDKADATRWHKLLDNGAIKVTGAELFKMLLDRAYGHNGRNNGKD